MCYAVFIATTKPQETSTFVAGSTTLFLTLPSDDEIKRLAGKFTNPYVYYVGSDTECSCGFEFHSDFYDDPEWQSSKASPQALIDLLKQLTTTSPIEYYCCWDGDWYEPIEYRRSININNVTLYNYFELIEREFIMFGSSSLPQASPLVVACKIIT